MHSAAVIGVRRGSAWQNPDGLFQLGSSAGVVAGQRAGAGDVPDDVLGEILASQRGQVTADPDAALLQFLETTYDAAANCARWDRAALEVAPGPSLKS